MDWIKLNDNDEIEFVSEEVKLVPELQAILTLNYNKAKGDNEGRKKFRAKEELKYMYLAYSPKSPYKDYTESDRIQEAKSDCKFPADWKESPELVALIAKFEKGSQSKVTRLLSTVNKFLDKFDKHLNSIDLNERNAAGGLIHSPKAVMETLERLPRLAETLQELENQARTGVILRASSKGDHEVGWMALNKKAMTKKTEEDDDLAEV